MFEIFMATHNIQNSVSNYNLTQRLQGRDNGIWKD